MPGTFEIAGECDRCENPPVGCFKTPFGIESLCSICSEDMQAAIEKFGMRASIWRCGGNLSDEKLLDKAKQLV